MIRAGVNKDKLEKFNSEVYTLIADDGVAAEAKERGVTRSIVGIEKACKDSRTKIFAIGNAPTALFSLMEMIRKGETRPDLVIGVPVGFVGAAESKKEFKSSGVPYIITNGRKGGSTIAVAALNAMIYQLQ
jgi:precorrin-8X/cobalt-precorrin-8 methylmutase